MAATRDIIATYRGPGKVMRRLLGHGTREDRALVFLIVACLMVFVAQTPRLARQAHDTSDDLQMLMGASLMAWLFIAPLLLYLLAGVTGIVARLLRVKITAYGARMALFWALLASCPLMLLWGLTAGFIGSGIQLTIVGVVWFAIFMWFWISGFIAATQEGSDG